MHENYVSTWSNWMWRTHEQGYPRGSKTPDEFRGFLTPVKPPNPRDFESHPPNFSLKFWRFLGSKITNFDRKLKDFSKFEIAETQNSYDLTSKFTKDSKILTFFYKFLIFEFFKFFIANNSGFSWKFNLSNWYFSKNNPR